MQLGKRLRQVIKVRGDRYLAFPLTALPLRSRGLFIVAEQFQRPAQSHLHRRSVPLGPPLRCRPLGFFVLGRFVTAKDSHHVIDRHHEQLVVGFEVHRDGVLGVK